MNDSVVSLLTAMIALAFYIGLGWGLSQIFRVSGVRPLLGYIPLVNFVFLLQVAGYSKWLALLFIIPGVSFVMYILISLKLGKRFGLGAGSIAGLILLPYFFYPIIGAQIANGKIRTTPVVAGPVA